MPLTDKNVAVWGWGREGQSVAHYLLQQSPSRSLIILDDRPLTTADWAEVQTAFPAASFRYHPSTDLLTVGRVAADVLVKAPGISHYRAEVAAAQAAGIEITTATNVWLEAPKRGKVIAVTGSNGKSTTSSLLAAALESYGFSVRLGGNIGQPLTDFLTEGALSADYWVLELSSYQTAELRSYPDVAVLLNLFPDHVQWHGTTEQYYADKLNIFGPDTLAVLNASDPNTQTYATHIHPSALFETAGGFYVEGEALLDGGAPLLTLQDITLKGTHNLTNMAAVLTVLRLLGMDALHALPALKAFKGLPHRLEVLGEKDGLTYVSDSISVTPEAAMAALHAFEGRPVTVLLGGQNRHQTYARLAEQICERPNTQAVTMYETGPAVAQALRQAAAAKGVPAPLHEAAMLNEAVRLAQAVTPQGGVVLLSPAAPSYDAFRDYRERGAVFREASGV